MLVANCDSPAAGRLNCVVVRCCCVVGSEMTELSDRLNFDREVIRVWFCNKRQTLKNNVKKIKESDSS